MVSSLLKDDDYRGFLVALRALADRDTDVANHFADMRAVTTSACHWRHDPFICPPHLLDSTQPEDFGYGTAEWRERWIKFDQHAYKKEVGHKLSCSRNLMSKVLGKTVLYSFRVNPLGHPPNPWGVIPELSRFWNRRCCYIKPSGMRCLKFTGNGILCPRHLRSREMRDAFGEQIKDTTLRDHYLRHLENPNYKNANQELAIMRALLSQLLGTLDGKPTDYLYYDALQKLCKGIGQTIEVITRVETKNNMRLSIEQLQSLIDGVVGIVVKVLEPSEDQLVKLSESIGNLRIFKRTDMETPVLSYGMQEAGAKMTTAKDAFTPDEVIKDAFTEEEVRQERADADEGIHAAMATAKQREVARELGLE